MLYYQTVKRFSAAAVFGLALLTPAPAWAQLAPFNGAGVTLSHIHLTVTDVDAHKHFWTSVMGGTSVEQGPFTMVQFPGVFIVLTKGQPTGPPGGSVVNHFGFVYKDIAAQKAHWKAVNADARQGGNDNQGHVWGPDGIDVEYFGDPTLTLPVKMEHFHLFISDVPGAQAWYQRAFGGVPGQRPQVAAPGWVDCNHFPGMTLSYGRAGSPVPVPTRGRTVDHLGFEVKNLDAFVKRLQREGIKIDVSPSQLLGSKIRSAFLTDPWGTYIELTENFMSAAR